MRIRGMMAAGLVIGLHPAFAADFDARRAPYAYGYERPAYDWSGFYAGVNAGYVTASASAGVTVGGVTLDIPKTLDGAVGGVQAGYNWHDKHLLLGLEADVQASSQRNDFVQSAFGVTASLTNTIPWFATARGRLGVTLDQWLAYVTGGVAIAGIKSEGSATIAGITQSISVFEPQASWVLGAGVETALWSSRWTAKAEYIYIDSIDFSSNTLGLTTRSHATNSILRAGVNYRFGQPAPPPAGPRY